METGTEVKIGLNQFLLGSFILLFAINPSGFICKQIKQELLKANSSNLSFSNILNKCFAMKFFIKKVSLSKK